MMTSEDWQAVVQLADTPYVQLIVLVCIFAILFSAAGFWRVMERFLPHLREERDNAQAIARQDASSNWKLAAVCVGFHAGMAFHSRGEWYLCVGFCLLAVGALYGLVHRLWRDRTKFSLRQIFALTLLFAVVAGCYYWLGIFVVAVWTACCSMAMASILVQRVAYGRGAADRR